jgi:hypothetical protein
MKKLTFKAVLITACTMVLIACAKNEAPMQQSEAIPTKTNIVNYVPPTVANDKGRFFQSIDTICPAYLQYTTKMDITGLQNNKEYSELSDGNLTIKLLNLDLANYPFTKHDQTASEWWKDWNVKPYVESNNPPILYQGGGEPVKVVLSKKCYVLGFELATPIKATDPPLSMYALYYNTDLYIVPDDIGFIYQDIKWPNGARLFAIKSDIPFNMVRIDFSSYDPHNYAITNIRYITDKEVYDKHKHD